MELNERTRGPDVDLSPRTAPPPQGSAASTSSRRRLLFTAVLTVLAVAVVVVVWQGLTNASLYFRNADEAVAEQQELGDRRFRLQGAVVRGSIVEDLPEVRFTVAHDGVEVPVHHVGDPPELFEEGVPVVLEGRWDPSGEFFASDRVLVKHDEAYEAENPDRVDEDLDPELVE